MPQDFLKEQKKPEVDFSQIREERVFRTRWITKVLKWVGIVLGVFMGVCILVGLINATKLIRIYENALEAKAALERAQHVIVNRDFEQGAAQVSVAHEKLLQVKQDTDELFLVRYIPVVRAHVLAVDALLETGVRMAGNGTQLLMLADDLTDDILNESIPWSEISDAKKREIVEKVREAKPLFVQTRDDLSYVAQLIEEIDSRKLLAPLAEVVDPLQQYLPLADAMMQEVVPLIEVLPEVAGFDTEKTYLFLLQNNHELRPTGGFIGTYGILKLHNGSIKQLITDNVYNLDRAFQDDKDTLTPQQVLDIAAPQPIQEYLEQRQWGLRDVNWSPDFPTTAQDAITIYNAEVTVARDIEKQIFLRDPQAREEDFQSRYIAEEFDGVIAITPQIIEKLLEVTGPVVVDGIRFTSENFQDELSYRVTFEAFDLDVDLRSRKDIIRRITDQITSRLLSLPYTRLLDVGQIAIEELQAKTILVMSRNAELQLRILERGWAGEVRQENDVDFLFVVDSNLGSLKTDQFIKRNVTYEVRKEGDEYLATVRLTHTHTGEFAWNSTRLRSYTRVYVPQGSVLLSSRGADLDDSTKNPEGLPGEVDVYDEFGKTVFGAFIATEPRESSTLVLTYKLPESVKQMIQEGSYNLLFQKQPGVVHELTVDLSFGTTIRNASPEGEVRGLFSDGYTFTDAIHKDTWITLKL
jgi:hypothetical protein